MGTLRAGAPGSDRSLCSQGQGGRQEAGLRGAGQQPVAPHPPHFRGKLRGSECVTLALSEGCRLVGSWVGWLVGWWVGVVSGRGPAPQRVLPENGPHGPRPLASLPALDHGPLEPESGGPTAGRSHRTWRALRRHPLLTCSHSRPGKPCSSEAPARPGPLPRVTASL